jgi:hypothetical protein
MENRQTAEFAPVAARQTAKLISSVSAYGKGPRTKRATHISVGIVPARLVFDKLRLRRERRFPLHVNATEIILREADSTRSLKTDNRTIQWVLWNSEMLWTNPSTLTWIGCP